MPLGEINLQKSAHGKMQGLNWSSNIKSKELLLKLKCMDQIDMMTLTWKPRGPQMIFTQPRRSSFIYREVQVIHSVPMYWAVLFF